MYKRNNGRTTYKSNRRTPFKKSGGYQNYKVRNKGNLSQQYNKYLKLAKESFRSGDRVQSEYFYQFTDHYYRLMIELGITIEENVFFACIYIIFFNNISISRLNLSLHLIFILYIQIFGGG